MKRRSVTTPLSALYSTAKKQHLNAEAKLLESTDDQTERSKFFTQVAATSRLAEPFYDVDCITLAKNLLGKTLCRRIPESGKVLRGTIVETESYAGSEDQASHSFNGKRTLRNEPMFMKPGTSYVYFTYGMYHCFNISSSGDGAAVLVRAVEPLEELETMTTFRAQFSKSKTSYSKKNLCNGPSKLCIAFEIDKLRINKEDLCTSDLIWIESNDDEIELDPGEIIATKRIGLGNSAGEWLHKPLRFLMASSLFVSVRPRK